MNQIEKHITKIGIVGYGRLARHLAPALSQAGLSINQWCIRNKIYHDKIKVRYGISPVEKVEQLNDESDLILLMISDTAIYDVSRKIPEMSSIICHTSGMTPLEIMPQHLSGIFYPLNTFNGKENEWDEATPIFIHTRDPEILTALTSVANKISDQVQPISPNDLQIVHLAAVISQNFSNHLIAQAERLLTAHGLERILIHPLLRTMIRNLDENPASLSQTGPAIRKDRSTIKRQLEILQDHPDLKKIYALITASIQNKSFD